MNTDILLPIFYLAIFTFSVLIVQSVVRSRAVSNNEHTPEEMFGIPLPSNSSDFIKHPKGGIVNNFTSRAEYDAKVFCTIFSHAAVNGQNEPEWQNLDAPKCIVNTDYGIKAFMVHDAINEGESINLSYKTNREDPELLLNHYQLQSREYWETVKMHRGDCNHWYTGNTRGWHAFYSLDIGDIIDGRLKRQNEGIVL